MRTHLRLGRYFFSLVGTFCLAMACASGAASPLRRYDLPPGPLVDVLQAFASQSGAQMLYPAPLMTGRYSTGLHGTFTAPQALAQLLTRQGLQAESTGSSIYLLKPLPRPQRPIMSPARIASIPPLIQPRALTPIDVNAISLRRTQVESIAPLTVIDREQIERSGYQTLYDLLRVQPGMRVSNTPLAMTRGAEYQYNGVSGATGGATVGLHSLGSAATLFLVDGQRMIGYGLSQNDFSVVNDLNSIPLQWIERIEILRDGASTVYGADAMAGVVNLVLRHSMQGATLSGTVGMSAQGDAAMHRLTASFGGRIGTHTRAFFSIDEIQRDPILGKQREWSIRDRQAQGIKDVRSPLDLSHKYFYVDGGRLRQPPGLDCASFHLDTVESCPRDPTAQSSLQTGLNNRSMLLHIDHDMDDLRGYADFRWTRVRQRQQMAPVSRAVYSEDSAQTARGFNYSFADLGPVRDRTVSNTLQMTLGLAGIAAQWNWNMHIDGQRNDDTERLDGMLRTASLLRALENQDYHFGASDNPRRVLRDLSPPLWRHAQSRQDSLSGQIVGPLGSRDGGETTLSAGAEIWRNRLTDIPDELLRSGQIYQFSSPQVRHSNRWSAAAYAVLSIPLARRWEASLGWRQERSEGYAGAGSPKLGLKWNPLDSLSLRASIANGYRTPNVYEVNRSPDLQQSTFYADLPRRLLPCRDMLQAYGDRADCALRLQSVNNSKLHPETSRSYTVGTIWAPTSNLSVALDLYQIERRNEVNLLPISYALEHVDEFPELFQRDSVGRLYAFNQQPINLGHSLLRSINLDFRYRVRTRHTGQFDFNFYADYLQRFDRWIDNKSPVEHQAGYASEPKLSALASIDWRYKHWGIGANLRYTGRYRYEPYAGATDYESCPDSQKRTHRCATPAFSIVDLNLAYGGFAHWTLALNLQNALDHHPVYYGMAGLRYNPLFDDVAGRYLQLSFSYQF